MKLSLLAITSLATASSAFFTTPSPSTSSTKLFISSWGAKGPPSRWKEPEANPAEKISAYLKEPEPIAARSNLDGSVLVSGWVNTRDRTDQTVFDFLNHEDSAFAFDKIIAFTNDSKFAKKRLISRSARYSGLMDKLDFIQAESEGALPTLAQLEGVKSWVVNAQDDLSVLGKVATLVKESAVENVSILLSGAQSVTDSADATEALSAFQSLGDGKQYTIVAVGAISEEPEGKMPYAIEDFGSEEGVLPSNATYSRDESLRLVTECLGLVSGSNKALVFSEISNVNATEFKLVKGLREGGYTRPQEIDHMLTKGAKVRLCIGPKCFHIWQTIQLLFFPSTWSNLQGYEKACEDYKTRVPEKTPHDEWLAEKQRELDESAAERKARVKAEYEEKKTKEIEDIAREWAKREYFRKSMSGDMPYSEEEYIKSVWERALFEGDLKYRMLRGMDTDERKELADFKKKQEKKKATMLERAKASLQEMLDEDEDSDDDE